MWQYNYSVELYHYGIPGMKWGRRKAKYASEDHKRAHSKKKTRDMSDDELRKRINRLQMEDQYKKLSKPKSAAVKKILTGVLIGSATAVATTYVTKYMKSGAGYAEKKIASLAKTGWDKLGDKAGDLVLKNIKF